jgi:hypothetical protein
MYKVIFGLSIVINITIFPPPVANGGIEPLLILIAIGIASICDHLLETSKKFPVKNKNTKARKLLTK